MSSLKNLLIIAVLAAVGYGVYTSLARNNAEPGQRPGAADGWPAVPTVEMPDPGRLSPPPGGPLALGGSVARPVPAPALGNTAASAPSGVSLPADPASSVPGVAGTIAPASPYPSSVPAATGIAAPAASLGVPADGVHNLVPPPETSPAMPPVQAANGQAPPAGNLLLPSMNPPATAANSASPAVAGGMPPASPGDDLLDNKFAAFMAAVQKKLDEGKLADAHLALSSLYNNNALPPQQAMQVTELLDQLAGTVIYSRQHYLEPAYVTQPGDTLEIIAQKYNLPWQLLAQINGLMPSGATAADSSQKYQPLSPGMELKVVRGPFEAVVRLDKRELTLMVQNRYAGRFPIGIGRDSPKLDGDFTVHDKTPSPAYYGADGVTIKPNDPQNPLGGAWIGLTDRIGIHGTNDPKTIGRDDNRGAICVGDRDLQDLYGILSVGSRVTIMR
jgi:hypothetical protein